MIENNDFYGPKELLELWQEHWGELPAKWIPAFLSHRAIQRLGEITKAEVTAHMKRSPKLDVVLLWATSHRCAVCHEPVIRNICKCREDFGS